MIVDPTHVKKYKSTGYYDWGVLCRCDTCGKEIITALWALKKYKGGVYTNCQKCAASMVARNFKGIKRSEEHRRKTGIASRGRNKSAACLESARKSFTGKSNPNWIADRVEVSRREKARKAAYGLVHATLRRLRQEKREGSFYVIGYTSAELRAHLEANFLPGMSWENRSLWHIDHVKPVAQFIREGVTDPKIINALANLKPIWALDNLKKNSRWFLTQVTQ